MIIIPLNGLQKTNALPVIPAGQLHIGTWLYTLQTAFWPQEYKDQCIYYVNKFESKDNLY